MTREISTEIRDYNYLPSIKTYKDVLKIDSRKLIKGLKTKELASAKLYIAEVVLKTILISEQNPSKEYLSFIVDACFNQDPYMSPEEIASILYYGSTGKYGKLFGKFSPDVLTSWFQQFTNDLAVENELIQAEKKKKIQAPLSPKEEMIMRENYKANKESWEVIKARIEAKSPKKYQSIKEYCIDQDVNYSMFVQRWESYWRAMFSNFDLRDEKGRTVLPMDEYISMKWKQILKRINLGKDVEPKLYENQASRITP